MKKDVSKKNCVKAVKNSGEEQEAPVQDGWNDQQKQINESGSVVTHNHGHTIHCLTIIGQIEGHYISPSQNKTTKYEHVIPQIVAVEEDPEIDGLLMLLNTVGGDCGLFHARHPHGGRGRRSCGRHGRACSAGARSGSRAPRKTPAHQR